MKLCLLLMALVVMGSQQSLNPSISIVNTNILTDTALAQVFDNGTLNHVFNDSTYNYVLDCKNGELTIINSSKGNNITFAYSGLGTLDDTNTHIAVWPNNDPKPYLTFPIANTFILWFNCSNSINDQNYFNKVNVELMSKYNISFMLDCDPGKRHKTFQFGYLLIAVLNAMILVGVAMHSYMWSIKYQHRRIKISLRWFHILMACVVGVVLFGALYLFAFKEFASAFLTLRYVGIVVSIFFVFVCFNEVLYLFHELKKRIFHKIRICDIGSGICTIIVTILAFLFESWIFYDFLACCICVASIKLFHFSSLKEAFLSMLIMIFTITMIAIALHYLLPDRSYNDYATELSSPLFLMFPDLDKNLFKKCSWLIVVDVIVPGVVLAFLRSFDENRGSKWGGVYTVWGNISVILGTILWIGLQAIYPFSIPFCLVTYLCLMLTVFLLAWTRNEWTDLYNGTFMKQGSLVDDSKLIEENRTFSRIISNSIIQTLKHQENNSESQGSRIEQ